MSTTSASLNLPLTCELVVNGEVVKSSSGRQFLRENPANYRETVTVAEEGTAAEAKVAIDAARTAFDTNTGQWVTNFKLREKVLFKAAELMRAHAGRLAKIVSLEVGMPMRQATPHVTAAADVVEFYGGLAGKLYGESLFLPSGSLINLVKEPVGVVGLITPWNFPLTQTARKVAPALAVGCTVVIKPSSFTPASTFEFVKLLLEAGAPKGVVNFVPGPGATVGSEFVHSPKVDKISFTGETATGKRISVEAAENLKRLSLELGGKAPFIVFDDSDIEAASNAAIFGMFRNAGQACGATTRLILQDKIHDAFVDQVIKLARRIEVGSPLNESTDMGPVVSKAQEQKILENIKSGLDSGFELVLGGKKLRGGEYETGYYIEPTIFVGVDNSSKIAQEEIFGPVVVVMSFKEEEEAIHLANDVPYGLVAGVWSKDYTRALRVARRIRAGTIWVGDNYAQPVEGIWGGFKQSGIGRELGPYGIDDFVEVKQIFTDGTGLAMKPAYKTVMKE